MSRKGGGESPPPQRPNSTIGPMETFTLRRGEIERQGALKRTQRDLNPNTKRPKTDTRDTVTRIIAEASMSAIEAEPSDSRTVNVLRSFRAQADALGALGVFDSPTTVIGTLLHEETGGHEQLLQRIDAHIARERAKEPVVNMDAYKQGQGPPEALPYNLFGENEALYNLEIDRILAELDSIVEIDQAIDTFLDSEDFDKRIHDEMRAHTTKIVEKEQRLVNGIIQTIDTLLATNPAPNSTGRWSLVVKDPAYARLSKEHNHMLAQKAKLAAFTTPSRAQTTSAVDEELLLPPDQVTSTIWDRLRRAFGDYAPDPDEDEESAADNAYQRRQAEMERLKTRFNQHQIALLEQDDFVENVGGVVDYVLAFGKYSAMEHLNNPIQATLTAIPIGLGIMAATGTAGITMPIAVGGLVVSNTVKGVLNRLKRNEPITPPAARKLAKFVKENKEYALVSSTLGTMSLGLPGGWVLEALNEWKLLNALRLASTQTFWGPVPPNSAVTLVERASEIRNAIVTLRGNPPASLATNANSTLMSYRATKGTTNYALANEGWTREVGGRSVRKVVDAVWSGSLDWVGNVTGALVIAGSTIWKIVSFETDFFRPDRARLFLYHHDPAKPETQRMLGMQAWALPAVSILYTEDDENKRGELIAPQTDDTAVRNWLPAKSAAALQNASKWKSWYARQTDWRASTPRVMIKSAKQVAEWSTTIRVMERDLEDAASFRIVPTMKRGMEYLKSYWDNYKTVLGTLYTQSGRSAGQGHLVQWTSNLDSYILPGNLTKMWYVLYKVLEYQYRYVTGGVDPSNPAGNVHFRAWAHNDNLPRLEQMLDDVKFVYLKAEAQSKLENGGREQIVLSNFASLENSAALEQMFYRYYPAARDLDIDEQTLSQQNLDQRLRNAPVPAFPALPPLGPVQVDGAAVASPIVDEVYARMRALRL